MSGCDRNDPYEEARANIARGVGPDESRHLPQQQAGAYTGGYNSHNPNAHTGGHNSHNYDAHPRASYQASAHESGPPYNNPSTYINAPRQQPPRGSTHTDGQLPTNSTPAYRPTPNDPGINPYGHSDLQDSLSGAHTNSRRHGHRPGMNEARFTGENSGANQNTPPSQSQPSGSRSLGQLGFAADEIRPAGRSNFAPGTQNQPIEGDITGLPVDTERHKSDSTQQGRSINTIQDNLNEMHCTLDTRVLKIVQELTVKVNEHRRLLVSQENAVHETQDVVTRHNVKLQNEKAAHAAMRAELEQFKAATRAKLEQADAAHAATRNELESFKLEFLWMKRVIEGNSSPMPARPQGWSAQL